MARTDWKRPSTFEAPQGRRRIALELSYDGRSFCGWQSQTDEVSVQSTVKDAVIRLTGQENVEVIGSGRTDSKVHAYGQVAHIELDDCSIPSRAFCMGLNSFLPYSIRIRRSWDVPNSFHARYSAMAREYRYFLIEKSGHDSFEEGLVTFYRKLPDTDLLQSYARCLVGTHDFTTFSSAKDICPSKMRDIYESRFEWTTDMYGNRVLCYTICGNAFLYHMVRSLVGSMIQFALEGRTAEQFRQALDAKDRRQCGKTADPDGLYLWRISYDPEEYRWFEERYGH